MCIVTLYDDWHFAFYFGLDFVLLLFILTSCHYGLMMLKVEGFGGAFFILHHWHFAFYFGLDLFCCYLF